LQQGPLAFLEDWYAAQCDADWEHSWGVEIGTLDNPGWRLRVDLDGTSWEGRCLERTTAQRDEHDWLQTWSDGHRWEAACGPQNLSEALEAFREFLRVPVEDDRYEKSSEEQVPSAFPRLRYVPPDPGSPKWRGPDRG
jgi:hypothetical protein